MGPFQSAASSFGLSAVSLERHYESEIDTVIAAFAGDVPPSLLVRDEVIEGEDALSEFDAVDGSSTGTRVPRMGRC
jgi:hypothetical protein